MTKGKAYNIWKSRLKYVSRLKKHMYYWLVQDGFKTDRFGRIVKNWRKARNWKELDEKGGHSKLLKKTPSMTQKTKWEKVYERKVIKNMRDDSKRIIDEELNNL